MDRQRRRGRHGTCHEFRRILGMSIFFRESSIVAGRALVYPCGTEVRPASGNLTPAVETLIHPSELHEDSHSSAPDNGAGGDQRFEIAHSALPITLPKPPCLLSPNSNRWSHGQIGFPAAALSIRIDFIPWQQIGHRKSIHFTAMVSKSRGRSCNAQATPSPWDCATRQSALSVTRHQFAMRFAAAHWKRR